MLVENRLSLEPIEQKSLTELVAQRLIALLSSGALGPGDKLPPERELAKQLEVGRTTVREALKLLTLSGVLDARRGDGTYVRQEFTSFLSQQIRWPVLLSAQQVDEIVEVRDALEVKAVRLAAERATPEEIRRIDACQQLLQIEARDLEQETELDLQFHHAIAEASHNELLSTLMRSLQNVLRQYIALAGQMTDRVDTTATEHLAIYDAIATRDPDAAEKAMVEHLAISRKLILKMVR